MLANATSVYWPERNTAGERNWTTVVTTPRATAARPPTTSAKTWTFAPTKSQMSNWNTSLAPSKKLRVRSDTRGSCTRPKRTTCTCSVGRTHSSILGVRFTANCIWSTWAHTRARGSNRTTWISKSRMRTTLTFGWFTLHRGNPSVLPPSNNFQTVKSNRFQKYNKGKIGG